MAAYIMAEQILPGHAVTLYNMVDLSAAMMRARPGGTTPMDQRLFTAHMAKMFKPVIDTLPKGGPATIFGFDSMPGYSKKMYHMGLAAPDDPHPLNANYSTRSTFTRLWVFDESLMGIVEITTF